MSQPAALEQTPGFREATWNTRLTSRLPFPRFPVFVQHAKTIQYFWLVSVIAT